VDTALARMASGTECEAAELRVRSAVTLGLVDALLSGIGQEAASVSVYGLADAVVVKGDPARWITRKCRASFAGREVPT
jgi:hypothetical protein